MNKGINLVRCDGKFLCEVLGIGLSACVNTGQLQFLNLANLYIAKKI